MVAIQKPRITGKTYESFIVVIGLPVQDQTLSRQVTDQPLHFEGMECVLRHRLRTDTEAVYKSAGSGHFLTSSDHPNMVLYKLFYLMYLGKSSDKSSYSALSNPADSGSQGRVA